jgi:hypothetical protein
MSTYDEAKLNAFTAATTVTVVGVTLDVADSHPLRSQGYQPIKTCVCFTDPCPCDGDSSEILWVFSPRGDVKGVTTNKKTEAGEELYNFKLDIDATIIIESYERIRVSDLLDNVQRSGTSHQKLLSRTGGVSTNVLGKGIFQPNTKGQIYSDGNTGNQITVPNRFPLGVQMSAAKCPPSLLSTSPDGAGLGVWVLISENAQSCTYHYAGGIV